MNNETQLQIVITAVNNAQSALDDAGDQLQSLGTQASEAATVMTDSMQEAATAITNALTPVEEANAEAAVVAASQWSESFEAIPGVTQEAFDAISDQWLSISESASTAATGATEAWQTSLQDLQTAMSQTEDDTDAAFEAMGTAAGSAGGTFGYFHNLILGLMAERIGDAGQSFIESIVNAVTAGDATDKIQQLTTEIQTQQAAILTHQAAEQNWTGTTAEVTARHVAAAAAIDAERVKIEQLTLQLTPLEAAQKAGADAGQQYAAAAAQLNTDWQAFLATLGSGGFIQQLTQGVEEIDKIVNALQRWAAANPQLATEILKFIGIFSEALIVIGSGAIAFAMIMLVASSAAGPFVLVAAAIALVAAGIIAFWPQIATTAENVWRSVTSAVQTAVNDITQWINGLLATIEHWGDEHPIIFTTIAGALAGILIPAFMSLVVYIFGTLIPAIAAWALSMTVTAFNAIVDMATTVLTTGITSLATFAAFIYSTVIPAILAWAAAELLPLLPFILVGAAVALLVALIVVYHKQILEAVETCWNTVINFLAIIELNIYNTFVSWGTNLNTWWQGLWNGILNFLKNIVNDILNVVNSIISAVSKVTGGIGGVLGQVGSIVTGAISALHLAEGGIVSSPTFALIGEAGPEAVIPLSAFNGGGSLTGTGGGLGGGNGNINVYIQGGTYLNQGGAQQIAQALATMIGRQIKLTTV